MNHIKSLIIAVAICLSISTSSFAADKIFNAETTTLDNGLMVVVIPNHRVPVITHMVWYRVGAADEQAGLSGIAHFLEHLLFKGSDNVAPGEFSKTVKSLGGQDNAFTSYDYTAFFQTVTSEHLEKVMEMEADRMRNILLREEDIESERKVVIEERRQVTENDPFSHFSEQLSTALFPNHPYGTPIIGWLHEIEGLDRLVLKSFYDRWYAPNNAILVVSGDITMKELKPLAEKIYGTIPKRNVPTRNWPIVPPLPGKQSLELHHPSIQQPAFMRIYRVPSFNQSKEDSLAFQVLENIVSAGASTRFYKDLVIEQKVATGASLSYGGNNVSDSKLYIQATPTEGVTLEELEAAIDNELQMLIDQGVTDEELSEAKSRLKDQSVFARDSITGPAMVFGRMLITGSSIDDIEYWPDQIDSVTKEQVQEVAARFLDPKHYGKRPYVNGYLYPAQDDDKQADTQTPQTGEAK